MNTQALRICIDVARGEGLEVSADDAQAELAALVERNAQLLEALKGLLAADNADTYAIVGRDNDGHPLNAAGVARQKARAAIASATGEA